jgi:signal transduction histidine kinase
LSSATAIAHDAPATRTRRLDPGGAWLVAAAGGAAAVGTMALALASDMPAPSEPAIHAGLLDWLILSYVFSGLIAWSRRPESRFGPLMVVAGFVIALNALRWSNAGLPHTVGSLLNFLPAAAFLHVYLAFPTGELQTALERVLVAATYATALALQLAGVLLGGFGPHNVLTITDAPGAADAILRVQLVLLSALMLAGVAVLHLRRRRAGRPARRSIALLVDSFAVALVMIAVLFLTGLFNQASAVVPIQRATFVVLGLAPIAFLVGLLHARLARSAVAGLVVELKADPGPAELRDALARALRDRSLTLVYWLPEYQAWADLEGRPVALADLEAGRATTLIDRAGEHVATLVHDPALDDEPELLEAVAAAAGLALENGRLQVELRARLEDLRGSRARLVEAGDAERRRLERNLHDGAQQRLVSLALGLQMVSSRLPPDSEEERLMTAAREDLAASLQELRELAQGIHPAVLSDFGLEVALESVAIRAAVPVDLDIAVDGSLPPAVEVAAYYLVCEALTNVAKYAGASRASVVIEHRDGRLVVQVADDGVGGADPTGGSGLRGLADRVEALEGTLRVLSPAARGTTVRAEMPCA